MFPVKRLVWPEMKEVAIGLIDRMREGHKSGAFSIPVVDFLKIFSPYSNEAELEKIRERGDIEFKADSQESGLFSLANGDTAVFDLHRESFVIRIPTRMSGRYTLSSDGFTIKFNPGEELEGCKRLFILICNRVVSVEVTSKRVQIHLPISMLDLTVDFD
jgi:hypothetical protein